MPVETRPRNKNTHPGLVLREAQQRREESRKLKHAKEEAKATKTKARLQHIQEVSDLELSEAEHYKSASNTTPIPPRMETTHAIKRRQGTLKEIPRRKGARLVVASSEIDDSDVDEEPVKKKKPPQLRDAVEEMKARSRKNGRQHVERTASKGIKRGHEKDPNLILSPVAKRKKPAQTPAKKGLHKKVQKVVVVETSDSEEETEDEDYEFSVDERAEQAASGLESELSDLASEVDGAYGYDGVDGQRDENEAFLSFQDEQMNMESDEWARDQNVDADDSDCVDYPVHHGSSHEAIYDNDDNVSMQWDDNELEDMGAATQAYLPPTSSINHRTPKAWSGRHELELGADPSFTPRITKISSSINTAKAKTGKGKAKEQHPPPQLDHAGESWDLAPQDGSTFLDCDEREGEEHIHACFSPLKHGRRVDSQDLLTVNTGDGASFQQRRHARSNLSKSVTQVEDGDSDEEMLDMFSSKPRKKRARPVTSDLPSELLQPANKWKHEIMPALFLWVAARKDVWNISVNELVDALTTICRARVRKDYSLQRNGDTTGEESAEYRLAMQRLSDWRSGLGFSAMWLVNNLVDEGTDLFPDDEARVAWAGFMVDKYRFLYSSVGRHDMMPTGLFQSQVYVKILALHLSKFATDDSAWVPGLKSETDDHEPWGAMALAAAALERALCLWKDGDLSIDLVKRASVTRSRAITFIPKIGPKGVQTTYHTNFSELRWAKSTKKFFKTIETRVRLTEEKKLDVSHILSCAKVYVKPSKKGRSKPAAVNAGGEEDLDSDDSILGDTPKPIRTYHTSPSTSSFQPIQGPSLHAPVPRGHQSSLPTQLSSASRSHLLSIAPGSRGSSTASTHGSSRGSSHGSSVAFTRGSARGSSVLSARVLHTSSAMPSQVSSRVLSRASSVMPSSGVTSRASSAVPFRSHTPSTSHSGPPTSRSGPPTSRSGPPTSRSGPPTSRFGPPTGSGSLFNNNYSLYQLSTGLLEPPQPSKAALTSAAARHGQQTSRGPQASTSVLPNAPTSKGHHGPVSRMQKCSSQQDQHHR